MSGGSTTNPPRSSVSDCRKFVPNIFNKSKCSSCFKQKEEHSAEALECNRASRKISKCGYLFVAPGWDFTNPLNRTKRWQRRWFVLYDDGELTYSVDEHPETVPQARIDMTRVLEVAAAEDITGHAYSLAVTAPEGVTFVKGTCREETRWWADVLQVYPRNKGRHKRNATFPGGQATILQVPPGIRSNTPNPSRPRFNSCRSEPRSGNAWIQESTGNSLNGNGSPSSLENGNPSSFTTTSVEGSRNGGNANGSPIEDPTPSHVGSEKPPIPPEPRQYRDQPASSASPPTRDKLRAEDKARRRMNQQNERSIVTGGGVPSTEKLDDDACRRILLEHEKEREGKLRDIAASLTQPRVRRNKPRTSEPTRDVVDAANAAHQDKLIRGDPDGCGLDISGARYSPTSELRVDLPAEDLLNIKKGWLTKQSANKEWNKHWFVLRGCGLMYYRDPSAEDKGIMDGVIDLNTVTAITPISVPRNYGFQTSTWDGRGITVLSAVTAGIRSSWMSAIRKAANLPDPESNTTCQDNQQDANPQSPTASIVDRERDSIVPSTPVTPRSIMFSSDEEYRTASEGGRRESGDWSEMPISPPLTSNGDWPLGIKGSNWSDQANHEWSELPPSPPLTRTALSRVKARSRSGSRSRGYKRSRSSPPSSRTSTLDSIRSEDLMMACRELGEDEEENGELPSSNGCLPPGSDNPLIVELLESQVNMLRDQLDQNQSHPSALLVIIERQEAEIESLKSQLSGARAEIANAEKELARLRQARAEGSVREKQVDELLGKIQRSEQQRKKDLEDLDKVKSLYNRDKEILECKLLESEAILGETAERCEMLSNELSSSHATVEQLQNETSTLSDRLSQGIEENEQLYARVRELEGRSSLSATRERGRSYDSLGDLTNLDMDLDPSELDKERMVEEYEELRSRFKKAISEIRAMRRELREAHATQDALELEILAHRQEATRCRDSNQAQAELMAARIQDLANKLATSEKQARTLKQKLAKIESRDKRRSLSLKGRESFQISQEVEEKLADLEGKMRAIERGRTAPASKESSPSGKRERRRETKSLDQKSRLRRQSLDSAAISEPAKLLVRLTSLETRVANVAEPGNSDCEKDSSESSEVNAVGSELTMEVVSRLKKLERAMIKSKRRLDRCLGSTQAQDKAEKCLREVNDILEGCLDCKRGQITDGQLEAAAMVVSRFENVLGEKIGELAKRRAILAQSGQLDEKEKVKLLAERIAFESVVVGQLKRAADGRKSQAFAELVETSQLISNLKLKLRGATAKSYQNTSYARRVARLLANKLLLVGATISTQTQEHDTRRTTKEERAEVLNSLRRPRDEVTEYVEAYKKSKLKELARLLALETTSLSEDSSTKLIDDSRIRQAWSTAQETISEELVRSEVSRVMTRCVEEYEDSLNSAADTCCAFHPAERTSFETWVDAARSKLREHMDTAVEELSRAYEECLAQMKRNKIARQDSDPEQARELLAEFADVIAQKALIDARVEATEETPVPRGWIGGASPVANLIEYEDALSNILGEDQTDANLEAEFTFLYQRFAEEYEERISSLSSRQDRISGTERSGEQVSSIARSLAFLEEDILRLGRCLGERNDEDSRPACDSDWSSVCEKCAELRQRVRRLADQAEQLSCKRCEQLEESIQRLSAEHNEELEKLRCSQEKDLMDIKGELDNQRYSLTSRYEHEASTLRERARKLENRLNAMDSEHSAHVNELRAAYQRSISAELDTDAETRKRYKEEIKQLRGLCEKGLLAMENSHRRIISDMEEKHRHELENLRLEKEQALSEETQATLAALDAMRKAHEHEVQKEITKFKQEFLKQMQAREDIGALHKEHEEEMEEIKQEILSLSSKYSSKCVESAALEEKVGNLAKQLAQAQQHILQLDARNKQLRAHIVSETNDAEMDESVQLLRGRDTEIARQREEIHRLQQQLKHGDTPHQSSGGPSKSPSFNYSASYDTQRTRSSRDGRAGTRTSIEEPRSASARSLRKAFLPAEKLGSFPYKIERIESISLPYSNDSNRPGNNANSTRYDQPETNLGRNGRDIDCLAFPLWDSLRPRNGLPRQYQGGATATRISSDDARWPESKQTEKYHRPETYGLRSNTRHTSCLTPEPPALSVAELTRSPSVRWSGRSCRSLPPTPAPSYHLSLHPPLPAVGTVAERKKRFEL